MLRVYPAIISKHEDTDYGVVFLDFPGCITTGETIREAAEMALEALSLHVEGMVENSEPLPEPSPPDAPLPDWLADLPDHTVARVLIPVEIRGRAVRVNITLDEGLLARLDKAARAEGETRSGFIARAVRERLAR
ncbi:MAG TPA: type II toxin-antitoxin system HicB family antitoxin [Stellaceae bacterium]|nr:type II toxin-antitoxin system HicB family antitoxin [Stellaceae bacterium]